MIWRRVALICFLACSLRICALLSSACACWRIFLALVNSCSASSICRFACCLASSAKAFSAKASLSCSRASSLSPVTDDDDGSSTIAFFSLGEFLSWPELDWEPIESCNWVAWFSSELGGTEGSKVFEKGFEVGSS